MSAYMSLKTFVITDKSMQQNYVVDMISTSNLNMEAKYKYVVYHRKDEVDKY